MGRPIGAANKNKQYLLNRLKDMYGEDFDPVMKMAAQAVKLDNLADDDPSVGNQKESIAAWGRIAEFVTPKLKATELTTNALTISVQRKRYDGSQSNDTDSADS
jgi:hypothetical protein